jgi:predicted acyltransferase
MRYLSLDFFRGLTIALMIVVNNPGSWSHVYAPLRHAAWHGCTPTDLVFPFFLFIVGVALWFNFSKVNEQFTPSVGWKIARRAALIFLVGLALNAYPFFDKNWHELRIMGVLQRIGIAFGVAGFLCVLLPRKILPWAAGALLGGYWLAMWYFGGEDPYSKETNLVRQLDLALLGENHLYKKFGVPFDPEGLFSTLPASVNVMLGYLTGSWITAANNRIADNNTVEEKQNLCLQLLRNGVVIGIAGLVWNEFFPINKPLWTSSYVLYTCGLAMIFLSACIWMFDIKAWKKIAQPFVVFGSNPLFAFVMSGLVVKTLNIFKHTEEGSKLVITPTMQIYENIFAKINGGELGSLLYAIAYTAFIWLMCWVLYKRRIFIKL